MIWPFVALPVWLGLLDIHFLNIWNFYVFGYHWSGEVTWQTHCPIMCACCCSLCLYLLKCRLRDLTCTVAANAYWYLYKVLLCYHRGISAFDFFLYTTRLASERLTVLEIQNMSSRFTYLSKEVASHSMQSLLRPGSEPVNGDIVDQAGEVTAASPQCVPYWWHAQHNVEVVGRLLDKIRPTTFTGR